ncbi:FAD-dependent oxidoreductase [Nonomuraea spiralis]|uniref:FAD-dependent oxidoreductase n=1 Tax=Nonomuraea spiralis TaxID=46182 RepID=UPI0037ABE5BB
MSTRPLRVVVGGGGIGGLCLAQGLHTAGIDVAVFERDTAPDARLQGYRLNIEPVGSRALHDCLPAHLWHLLVATAGDPGPGMGVFTERIRLLMREDALPAERDPSEQTHAVSRVTLRRLLLSGLDDVVHFGKEFTGYRQNADGTVTALFADGTSATVDRVGDQLRAAGLDPDLLVQDAKDDDYVMWAYVAHRRALPADLPDVPAGGRGRRLRELVAARLTDWHPGLRELIARTPADTVERFDFATAERVKPWPTTNVTVLGDAIHSMPPVGGLGGNAALYDADVLRRALIAVGRGEHDLLPAVAAYERAMLKNGFAAVRAATMYLRPATLPSRTVRTVARTFFRLCGVLPPLRRAIFSD